MWRAANLHLMRGLIGANRSFERLVILAIDRCIGGIIALDLQPFFKLLRRGMTLPLAQSIHRLNLFPAALVDDRAVAKILFLKLRILRVLGEQIRHGGSCIRAEHIAKRLASTLVEQFGLIEIGRASCREGVWISVVDGGLG